MSDLAYLGEFLVGIGPGDADYIEIADALHREMHIFDDRKVCVHAPRWFCQLVRNDPRVTSLPVHSVEPTVTEDIVYGGWIHPIHGFTAIAYADVKSAS